MRRILMALALIGVPPAWSSDRKGTMDEDCCGTSFHLRALRRAETKEVQAKGIVLTLFQGCPGHLPLGSLVSADWLKVEAKLCEVGSSQCEPATAAKIRIESVSHKGKHASGSYSVDFSNAGHEEGKFTVKYHHKGPQYICE